MARVLKACQQVDGQYLLEGKIAADLASAGPNEYR
ncbi:hypothetical protein ABH989_006188 [Bradyrhizobium ottawaense]